VLELSGADIEMEQTPLRHPARGDKKRASLQNYQNVGKNTGHLMRFTPLSGGTAAQSKKGSGWPGEKG